MADDVSPAQRARDHLGHSRWWLVFAAAGMMAVVGPYQYVWTAIETPIQQRLGTSAAAIGLVFSLFVIFQAGSQFPIGWYRDRHGPRGLSVIAAIFAGGGYIALSYATTVWQVYVAYSVGAIGVGIVYTVAVNTALKWFPDRRGLTTGVGTMAFAGGSAAFVPVVRANATVGAYPAILRRMGVLIAIVLLVGAFVLRDPPEGWRESLGVLTDGGSTHVTGRQYSWREMLRTWQFWLMYAMFIGVSAAGLMLTAKIVQFATARDLAQVTIPLGGEVTAATLAATVLPIAGGLGRLVLGEVSDRVHRRHAMAAAFTLCGVGVFAVVLTASAGATTMFVLAVVIATFFWSPQYTLFPSVVGDYYGERHSSANYALLYSGKVWGGLFGGAVAGFLVTNTSWTTTFIIGGSAAVLAGVGALVLRPPGNNLH